MSRTQSRPEATDRLFSPRTSGGGERAPASPLQDRAIWTNVEFMACLFLAPFSDCLGFRGLGFRVYGQFRDQFRDHVSSLSPSALAGFRVWDAVNRFPSNSSPTAVSSSHAPSGAL